MPERETIERAREDFPCISLQTSPNCRSQSRNSFATQRRQKSKPNTQALKRLEHVHEFG